MQNSGHQHSREMKVEQIERLLGQRECRVNLLSLAESELRLFIDSFLYSGQGGKHQGNDNYFG